ncbi:hypothetical protein AB0N05_09790 [Nocardia sp. NPDC051030]|uniref:hypothetical protein n=1 Tax=Nocardia sp. NPDC051030 TaxID=3155162 RepID=UPI003416E1A2
MFHRTKLSKFLLVAALVAGFSAALPVTANAQVAVYPGMTIRTSDRLCTVGATGEIGTQKYAVTAAHCAEPNATVYDDNGTRIGWYAETSGDDVTTNSLGFALVRLDKTVAARASNGSFGLGSANTEAYIGQGVCHIGWATRSCGAVVRNAANYFITDFTSDKGDSGGPVFHTNLNGGADFLGLLIGTNPDGQVIVETAAYVREQIDATFNGAYHFTWYTS